MSLSLSLRLLLLVSSLIFVPLLSADEDNTAMLEKIFQYEINNRAFAYQSISRLKEELKGSEQEAFWQAYFMLESLNKPLYETMAAEYVLAPNRFLVSAKTIATNIAFALFPQKMMSIMTDATIKYVEKLKHLPRLAREEHKEFFSYVVLQENAQANALLHAREGEYELAAELLKDFVQKHSEAQ